jgi:hypothetical protein
MDSDGDEIDETEKPNRPQKFILWFTFDIKVYPSQPNSIVELVANSMVKQNTTCQMKKIFSSLIDNKLLLT